MDLDCGINGATSFQSSLERHGYSFLDEYSRAVFLA
jgi:hypothetical protein